MDNFDVIMRSFDSTQIADLVVMYILNTLNRIIDLSTIGIYRDDGIISISTPNIKNTKESY